MSERETTMTEPTAAEYATTLRTLLVKAEALIYSTETVRDAYEDQHDNEDSVVTFYAVQGASRASRLYDYLAALAKQAGINPDTAEQDLQA